MTYVWLTIALLAAGTVVIKAAGPVLLGGRDLPPRLTGVVARLAPALLAALVVVETFGRDRSVGRRERDRAAAAAAALAARLPMIAVVVIAAAVTAAVRASEPLAPSWTYVRLCPRPEGADTELISMKGTE